MTDPDPGDHERLARALYGVYPCGSWETTSALFYELADTAEREMGWAPEVDGEADQ